MNSQCVELGGNCCTWNGSGWNDGVGGKSNCKDVIFLMFIHSFVLKSYLAWQDPAEMSDSWGNIGSEIIC